MKNLHTQLNKFKKSDNVIKTKDGYLTQCTQYKKLFTEHELVKYFTREYFNQ